LQAAPMLTTRLHALSTLWTRSGSLLTLCLLKWASLRNLLDHPRPQAIHLLVDGGFNFG
jgi:hypothetical protein